MAVNGLAADIALTDGKHTSLLHFDCLALWLELERITHSRLTLPFPPVLIV